MAKILIVEDEAPLNQLYKEELQDHGYEVMVAHSGRDALSMLRTNPVDLMILDLKLPDGSGLDYLCDFLRTHRKLKVIINTAYPMFKRDFRSWGAEAFVVKSSDLSELLCTVERVLHQKDIPSQFQTAV